jgi:hypothetical protein
MVLSLIYLIVFSAYNVQARTAMCILIVFACYSFFKNLEILAYLYWPAFSWLGFTFKNLRNGESHV